MHLAGWLQDLQVVLWMERYPEDSNMGRSMTVALGRKMKWDQSTSLSLEVRCLYIHPCYHYSPAIYHMYCEQHSIWLQVPLAVDEKVARI